MSQELKREYLSAIRARYRVSSRGKKSLIFDEFCSVCGYTRKYAIAILNGHIEPGGTLPRGRKVKYGLDVVYHLVRLWKELNQPGSTKFKAALSEWLEYDDHPRLKEDALLRGKILSVSRPQLDRLLKLYRLGSCLGLSTTRTSKGARPADARRHRRAL